MKFLFVPMTFGETIAAVRLPTEIVANSPAEAFEKIGEMELGSGTLYQEVAELVEVVPCDDILGGK